ncbi:LysR family transcriptional regulator [Brachybacterium sp. DNPG3]
MTEVLPNLAALELFVAVVDEGGLGAGARRLGIHQPNASRTIAQLEAQAGMALLDRGARGSRPTSAGLLYAAHARELLASARSFSSWLQHARGDEGHQLAVGASLTIAENLMPAWLARLRRVDLLVRVEPLVLNSTGVLERVRAGDLSLGFIETLHIPGDVNAVTVHRDELVVVVAPDHPWAARRSPLPRAELAATPLVVREGGSGTRDTYEELVGGAAEVEPAQVLGGIGAVKVAVAAGIAPAVLSILAVRAQLAAGELVRVDLEGEPMRRPLTAVWTGPRRLRGPAAGLVEVALDG